MDKCPLRVLAVTNMYPTPTSPFVGTFVEQQVSGLRQIGLSVRTLVLDRARKGMSVYLRTAVNVRSLVEEFDPHIIHVMYGGVMAEIVTRVVSDRATVVSFCGDDLLGTHLSGTVRKLISRYGIVASHKAARRATGIVVKSENLKNALPDDVSRSKVRIIPNGVNLERFKPIDRDLCRRQLGWSDHCLNVIFPANSGDPVKRPELAKAAVEMHKGSGITAQIHHLQGVPHHEVPLWLNAGSVLLLTSLHEGSPNIVKEALACDLPIVSLDIGDVRERIEGIEGCYLALPNPSDLAAKLSLVLAGPSRINGRTKVEALSLQKIAVRLAKFYKHIVGQKLGTVLVNSVK